MNTWACPKCTFRMDQPTHVVEVLHVCTDKVQRRLKNIQPPKVNIRAAIVAESRARFPEEACGFILSDGNMVTAKNVAEDPAQSFRIDDATAERWWPTGKVTGVWHSHCFDPAIPSADDEAMAHPELECWIYSVLDEQLGIYRPDKRGRLQLLAMEDLA